MEIERKEKFSSLTNLPLRIPSLGSVEEYRTSVVLYTIVYIEYRTRKWWGKGAFLPPHALLKSDSGEVATRPSRKHEQPKQGPLHIVRISGSADSAFSAVTAPVFAIPLHFSLCFLPLLFSLSLSQHCIRFNSFPLRKAHSIPPWSYIHYHPIVQSVLTLLSHNLNTIRLLQGVY